MKHRWVRLEDVFWVCENCTYVMPSVMVPPESRVIDAFEIQLDGTMQVRFYTCEEYMIREMNKE